MLAELPNPASHFPPILHLPGSPWTWQPWQPCARSSPDTSNSNIMHKRGDVRTVERLVRSIWHFVLIALFGMSSISQLCEKDSGLDCVLAHGHTSISLQTVITFIKHLMDALQIDSMSPGLTKSCVKSRDLHLFSSRYQKCSSISCLTCMLPYWVLRRF